MSRMKFWYGFHKYLLISAPIYLVLFVVFVPVHVLEIESVEDGERIFWRHIRSGNRFSFEQMNSVQLCRVRNDYEIDEDYQIILVSTAFSDHGVGLPSGPIHGGEFSIQDDGTFRISKMHLELSEIHLRVGREYDNVFAFGSRRINLSETYGNALFAVRTRKCAMSKYLLWRILNVR